MARLSEEEINQIRAKADIVDIIGHYLPLTRKGKNYVAQCPFHDDHDPSMSINVDKQIFKCFVCQTGGNVFGFVQKYEKISFIEAVYKVAELTGIHIDHSLALPTKKINPAFAKLYKANKETIEYTHYQLDTLDAKNIKEYLYKRNITDNIISKYEIGYNPDQDALYRFLKAKKIPEEDILNAGLCRLTSVGIKDVFSNRIMIPIHDSHGNPVGFTARRVLENDDAKYINTTETDVYKKGNLIFNYHRVKDIARHEKKVYLVEGAMDVLAFEKIGISNVIATLGTAITKEQFHLLKSLHVPIVLCYDGDKAGRNATYKFGQIAVKEKLPFEIVENHYGLDPDEIIDTYGKDELKAISNKTISWIDFLFEFLLTRYNLENYSQKKDFAIEMSDAISSISDDFEKDSYYIRLRELTDFDMKLQENHNAPIKKQAKKESNYKSTKIIYPKSGRIHSEYEILSQMLNGVVACNYYKQELGFLKDDDCNKLAIYIIDFYRSHTSLNVADLLDTIAEENVKNLLLDIANWELSRNEINMDALKEAVAKAKECFLEDQIQLINQKIKQLSDPLEKASLAIEKNKLIKKRGEILFKERK